MGIFFKTPEEKEQIRLQKMQKAEEDKRAIRESPVTQYMIETLVDEFSGDGNGNLLADFRSSNFARINFFKHGVYVEVFHRKKNPDGSIATPYTLVNFEDIGYENINSVMMEELKSVLFNALVSLPNMEVTEEIDHLLLRHIKSAW